MCITGLSEPQYSVLNTPNALYTQGMRRVRRELHHDLKPHEEHRDETSIVTGELITGDRYSRREFAPVLDCLMDIKWQQPETVHDVPRTRVSVQCG